jgi:hypothetical protein
VVIAGPIELDRPTEVDNGWVCRVDQLPEFLSRPAKRNSVSYLIEDVGSTFGVPVPQLATEPQTHSRESPSALYSDATTLKSHSSTPTRSYPADDAVRVDQRQGAIPKTSSWKQPRGMWSRAKCIWMFLLIWYVSSLIFFEVADRIDPHFGRPATSANNGASLILGLSYFALSLAVWRWIKLGRRPRVLQSDPPNVQKKLLGR